MIVDDVLYFIKALHAENPQRPKGLVFVILIQLLPQMTNILRFFIIYFISQSTIISPVVSFLNQVMTDDGDESCPIT